jgi:hypothetical protein
LVGLQKEDKTVVPTGTAAPPSPDAVAGEEATARRRRSKRTRMVAS